jgi:predicted nucleic acid-binding protein
MNEVFADAGYWIALFHPRDLLHAKALAVSQSIKGRRIVTSQAVLTEFLNHFAAFGTQFRKKSVQVIESLQQSSEVEIIEQTSAQFEAALDLYSKRPDKEWGLTDCNSFRIMQEREITDVLAHDEHFVQAGFTALLRF